MRTPLGKSDPLEASFASYGAYEPQVPGTLPGMRISTGNKAVIRVPGRIEETGDMAQPFLFPEGAVMGIGTARLEKSAVGQSAKIKLKLDGADLVVNTVGPGPVVAELPDTGSGNPSQSGAFFSGSEVGDVGGKALSIEVTQTGTEEPGEDLTIEIGY